jgi:signal transduction histidine kinase
MWPVTDANVPAEVVDKIPLLQQTFPGMLPEELAEMARLTRVQAYPANFDLCREGAYEHTSYIIAHGEAGIFKHIGEGEGERFIRKVGWGDYVGEMAPIQNAPRAATVRTLSDCVVLEISKSDLEHMLSRSPSMALNILRSTLNRMRANDHLTIQELQRTNRVLAQLDRNKLEFIEVAAHELRTPITVMKGYINVMKMDGTIKGSAMLQEVLEGISKGTERLHEIVNTMLDVTRIDSEKLKIAIVPVPVRSVVNDIVQRVKNEAASRQHTFIVEHAEDTPMIQADPMLIQKALYHVIMNAIKYTPDNGEIVIRTRPVIIEGARPGAEISVTDSGIGLASEHHELVFEKFYQVGAVALHSSSKTAFKGGGAGLGLAIAKGVVRAHGGKIWVESPGQNEQTFPGCTFYMQFPLQPGKPAK